MKLLIAMLFWVASGVVYAATDKSGKITSVEIWGNIAKASVCDPQNGCQVYWVAVDSVNGQAVLSTWLAAKLADQDVFVQGHDDRNPDHPYSNSSRFYGMRMK